jgi:acyl carrier protein
MTGFVPSSLERLVQATMQGTRGNTMPSHEQILNKLLSTLHERFAIDTGKISTASRLSDMGIDSLHLVDIMLDMENAFSFRFESLMLPPNPSIEQIMRAVMRDSEAPD